MSRGGRHLCEEVRCGIRAELGAWRSDHKSRETRGRSRCHYLRASSQREAPEFWGWGATSLAAGGSSTPRPPPNAPSLLSCRGGLCSHAFDQHTGQLQGCLFPARTPWTRVAGPEDPSEVPVSSAVGANPGPVPREGDGGSARLMEVLAGWDAGRDGSQARRTFWNRNHTGPCAAWPRHLAHHLRDPGHTIGDTHDAGKVTARPLH